jgi:hypothetical protein
VTDYSGGRTEKDFHEFIETQTGVRAKKVYSYNVGTKRSD